MNDYKVHSTAIVESSKIGAGTQIWAFAHIMPDVSIGTNCNIGDGVFIENGVRIGNGVTIKNNVLLWKGVTIEDYVFLGPNAVFCNDRFPRSPRMPGIEDLYKDESNWLAETTVEEGVSIGANATIVCGVRLGCYSMVGAGSVVTHDTEPYSLVIGNPAKKIGQVDKQGKRISI